MAEGRNKESDFIDQLLAQRLGENFSAAFNKQV